MLTDEMRGLIVAYTAGMVATTNDDGSPAVSPKATFVVVDDRTIAYGDIRSPGTAANLRARPDVEVCFLDVLARKAVRIAGTATIVAKDAASDALKRAMDEKWGDYQGSMSAFVQIDVRHAELILSPAYDRGETEKGLKAQNLARLNAL